MQTTFTPDVACSHIVHGMEQVFVQLGDCWYPATQITRIERSGSWWRVLTADGAGYPVESLAEMWATATTRPGA